eukprot:TRINITY_DN2533_c1_g1_i4.p2 TRINITY_DN2533_c1_g1~~TRINITY_DN2533_c1_g1_i4.p2  ORF type:complete len:129 (-),score=0.92 TRINITY_DN2533_c1_g1_i4:113-457(-)
MPKKIFCHLSAPSLEIEQFSKKRGALKRIKIHLSAPGALKLGGPYTGKYGTMIFPATNIFLSKHVQYIYGRKFFLFFENIMKCILNTNYEIIYTVFYFREILRSDLLPNELHAN